MEVANNINLLDGSAFIDLSTNIYGENIDAETIISEYAPGQYELTLKHQNSILKAADDILRLKRIIKLM